MIGGPTSAVKVIHFNGGPQSQLIWKSRRMKPSCFTFKTFGGEEMAILATHVPNMMAPFCPVFFLLPITCWRPPCARFSESLLQVYNHPDQSPWLYLPHVSKHLEDSYNTLQRFQRIGSTPFDVRESKFSGQPRLHTAKRQPTV